MFDILKSEFDTEMDFLKNEIVRLSEEVDEIKKKISQYNSELIVASKYKINELRSILVQDNRPFCPRCLIRTDSIHEMVPRDSENIDTDLFECKKCGWYFEITP